MSNILEEALFQLFRNVLFLGNFHLFPNIFLPRVIFLGVWPITLEKKEKFYKSLKILEILEFHARFGQF